MMGSSMGGLISLYALARDPELRGGVACLSTRPTGWSAATLWSTGWPLHCRRPVATGCTSTAAPQGSMRAASASSAAWMGTCVLWASAGAATGCRSRSMVQTTPKPRGAHGSIGPCGFCSPRAARFGRGRCAAVRAGHQSPTCRRRCARTPAVARHPHAVGAGSPPHRHPPRWRAEIPAAHAGPCHVQRGSGAGGERCRAAGETARSWYTDGRWRGSRLP